MSHTPGLGLMFTGFNASTLKDATVTLPPPPRGVNELKFVASSGAYKKITIPTFGYGLEYGIFHPYNWIVSWGDGTVERWQGVTSSPNFNGSAVSHDYDNIDTEYEIKITPVDPDEQGWLRAFGMLDIPRPIQLENTNNILRITSKELSEQAIFIASADHWVCMDMFNGQKKLTSLGEFQIPISRTEFGDCFYQRMFYNCTTLESIGSFKFPEFVHTVGAQCFYHTFRNCHELKSITNLQLPQKLKKHGFNFSVSTFHNCSSIVEIPKSIFGNFCISNADILTTSYKNMFSGCSIATGDMAGVPQLQISPTSRNACFYNTPNVLNVPTNWK